MKKSLLVVLLLLARVSFSLAIPFGYGISKYDEKKLYDYKTETVYTAKSENFEVFYKKINRPYISLLRELNSRNRSEVISQKEKVAWDNLILSYFIINYIDKLNEYKNKKDKAEQIIINQINSLNSYEKFNKFFYSYKQYLKKAKTIQDYITVISEMKNDFHYLWNDPFEWQSGTGISVE